MYTPLLDWTSSPFAAAYFAFIDIGVPQTANRAIYAMAQSSVEKKNKEIIAAASTSASSQTIEFVRPLSDENPRLVNQAGLFTRAPDQVSIGSWIDREF